MKEKLKESDLAKQLIKFFKGTNYEVYQEVTTHNGVCDVVFKYPGFLWAIECKLGMNLTVLAQARFNQRYFNYSSICIPSKAVNGKTFEFGREICKNHGIGILVMDKIYHRNRELLKAKLIRKAFTKDVKLNEKQKSFAEAGNANGERWTPFNQTVEELKFYIKKNPNCKLKDALSNIQHHYASLSSAQNSIRKWIKSSVIKGIEIKRGTLNLL